MSRIRTHLIAALVAASAVVGAGATVHATPPADQEPSSPQLPPVPQLPALPPVITPGIAVPVPTTSTTVAPEASETADDTTADDPAAAEDDASEDAASDVTGDDTADDPAAAPSTVGPSLAQAYQQIAGGMLDSWTSGLFPQQSPPQITAPELSGDDSELGTIDKPNFDIGAAPAASFDFAGWLDRLDTPGFELDLAVTNSTADWAATVARFHGSTTTTASSPEALMAGLLTTRALTNFAVDQPELFKLVNETGLTNGAADAAWRSALSDAQTQIASGAADGLLDPCSAGLLTIMASGSAAQGEQLSGDQCRPCIPVGKYLHEQMGAMFDGTSFGRSQVAPPGTDMSANVFNNLPSWQREVLAETVPMQERLNTGAGSSSCGAGEALDRIGSSITSDVFSQFGTPRSAGTSAAATQTPAANPAANPPAATRTPGVTNPFDRFGK